MKVFSPAPGAGTPLLDRDPFKLSHALCGHPSLSLENLSTVLPSLPSEQVMYSDSLLSESDNFESTFARRPEHRTIGETIESIRERDSYIMIRSPETDSSFKGLYRDLISDVESMMQTQGVGARALRPKLYLFIASPNSVTPFHLDRYSTLLLQFRGSKTVTVFPQWDERVVSEVQRERYVSYEDTSLDWSPQLDPLGNAFEFRPGEALHIPFAAPHHVRNGPDDVSISMSIIFNTEESMRWHYAIQYNNRMRRHMHRFGITPTRVARSRTIDRMKSTAWQAVARVSSLLGPA